MLNFAGVLLPRVVRRIRSLSFHYTLEKLFLKNKKNQALFTMWMYLFFLWLENWNFPSKQHQKKNFLRKNRSLLGVLNQSLVAVFLPPME
ncbi:MAG: hypothetical protein KR126chlam3_01109 [Chlamydiae bacterium]|nr:hypothetical protein [Chlamydiota bacterium]